MATTKPKAARQSTGPAVPVDWLLEGPAWVEYRTRVDLPGAGENDRAVKAARARMLADESVRALVAELADWPVKTLSNHKSAGHPIHKLVFLADIGLRVTDPGMKLVLDRVLSHRSSEGPFQVLMNVSPAYGGTGKDAWAWALCDAPLLVYALARMGLAADPRVRQAATHLFGLVRENGWPCASSGMGKFRGPGRKDDPCPYATLAMLRAASALGESRQSPAVRAGVEALLGLWAESRTRHPYVFYMGTDFRKMKAPLVWYDLLHVFDVLSRVESARGDARLAEMAALIGSKADSSGRFTPESVWLDWKGWEFGQKKEPSRWLTLVAHAALARWAKG